MPDINPLFFIQLFACVAIGLVIFNQAMLALGKRKGANPQIIAMEQKFVSCDDHKAHADNVNERLTFAARSRKEMHTKINHLEATTAQLSEQNKSQTDSISLLSADLRSFAKEQRAANDKILDRLLK